MNTGVREQAWPLGHKYLVLWEPHMTAVFLFRSASPPRAELQDLAPWTAHFALMGFNKELRRLSASLPK